MYGGRESNGGERRKSSFRGKARCRCRAGPCGRRAHESSCGGGQHKAVHHVGEAQHKAPKDDGKAQDKAPKDAIACNERRRRRFGMLGG